MTSPTPEQLRRIREADEPQDRPRQTAPSAPTREDFAEAVREPSRGTAPFIGRTGGGGSSRTRTEPRTSTETVADIIAPASETRQAQEFGTVFEITEDGRVRQVVGPQGGRTGERREFTQFDIGQQVDGGRITPGFQGRFFLIPDQFEAPVEEVSITGIGTELRRGADNLIVLRGGLTLPLSVAQFEALPEDERRALLGGRFGEFRELLSERLQAEGAAADETEADAIIDEFLGEAPAQAAPDIAAFQESVGAQVNDLQPTPGLDIRSQIIAIAETEAEAAGVVLDPGLTEQWASDAALAIASRAAIEPGEQIATGAPSARLRFAELEDPGLVTPSQDFVDASGRRLVSVPDGFITLADFDNLPEGDKRIVRRFGVAALNRARAERLRTIAQAQIVAGAENVTTFAQREITRRKQAIAARIEALDITPAQAAQIRDALDDGIDEAFGKVSSEKLFTAEDVEAASRAATRAAENVLDDVRGVSLGDIRAAQRAVTEEIEGLVSSINLRFEPPPPAQIRDAIDDGIDEAFGLVSSEPVLTPELAAQIRDALDDGVDNAIGQIPRRQLTIGSIQRRVDIFNRRVDNLILNAQIVGQNIADLRESITEQAGEIFDDYRPIQQAEPSTSSLFPIIGSVAGTQRGRGSDLTTAIVIAAAAQGIVESRAGIPESLQERPLRPGIPLDTTGPPTVTEFPIPAQMFPNQTRFPTDTPGVPSVTSIPTTPPEIPNVVQAAVAYINASAAVAETLEDDDVLTEEDLEAIRDRQRRENIRERARQLGLRVIPGGRTERSSTLRRLLEDEEYRRQLFEQARLSFIESGGASPTPQGNAFAQVASAAAVNALNQGNTPTQAARVAANAVAEAALEVSSVTTPAQPSATITTDAPVIPASAIAPASAATTEAAPAQFTDSPPIVQPGEIAAPQITATPGDFPSMTPGLSPGVDVSPSLGTVAAIDPFFRSETDTEPFPVAAEAPTITEAPTQASGTTQDLSTPTSATLTATATQARTLRRSQRPSGRLPDPELQGEEAQPSRGGLPTVAWRQVGQWIAVDPPYEIANFRFPTATPVGSRFFNSAADALAFVDATGIQLSEAAREHWLAFTDIQTTEGIQLRRELARELVPVQAEVQATSADVLVESQSARLEIERAAAPARAEAAQVMAERAPLESERDAFMAEAEAEMVDMGLPPKQPGRQLFGRTSFSFARARARPVIASATEVDFTDAN